MRLKDFIATVQHKVAITSVGPSTVRGHGKGVLKAAQGFLASISLARIPRASEMRFRQWLDRQTKALLDLLPVTGRPWGVARKAINLFLRDALYNQYLSRRFRISQIEEWLETPLDSVVARGLRSAAGKGPLPRWPGLKGLSPDMNDEYQAFASQHAHTLGIQRVHLDMYLWLDNR